MATKLDSFTLPRKPYRIYPWKEWTDGSIWRITTGEDFECKTTNMRAVLITHAYRNGFTVQTTVSGDTVEFQFSPRTPG